MTPSLTELAGLADEGRLVLDPGKLDSIGKNNKNITLFLI